ncbi:MAG: saccharopine dehydrogenase NADP-binding domain-containing protein [Phaeodactylibacter sp.]|uniref:saccharopine dehydrogenase family protein n=1 Tax=Phaeodactylibacter sp. TaxID=1940289 RepID=UPI0032EDB772
MRNKQILIYGANGYTGKLFAKYLIAKGWTPILAARSTKVEQTGQELNCATRIFSTEDSAKHLQDVDFLVNLAGPFSATQDGLIQGCISSKTHYLDIAGEFAEMENAFKYDTEARESGIFIIPAAGFGVVPTDIAAKIACSKLQNPNQLTIAYATIGGASRGTLKTVLKDIQKAGHILIDGEYKMAQPAQSEMDVTVYAKQFKAVYNPWRADLYTARLSTSVSNIETYSEFPGFVVSMMKGKLKWLRNLLLNRLIKFFPEGPSDSQLKKGKTYIKAIAKNDNNETASVEIKGPEAYLFTVNCIEKVIELISEYKGKKGCLTPSMLGTEWLKEIEGVEIK